MVMLVQTVIYLFFQLLIPKFIEECDWLLWDGAADSAKCMLRPYGAVEIRLLFFLYLGIKDPEGFGKKLEENVR